MIMLHMYSDAMISLGYGLLSMTILIGAATLIGELKKTVMKFFKRKEDVINA